MAVPSEFASLAEFYPYYLNEHRDRRCRTAHFIGTTFALVSWAFALITLNPAFILLGFIGGYGCAWFGHFYYEKNKPATFRYPVYSLLADGLMYRDMWLNRL